jgi:hypothetical protein
LLHPATWDHLSLILLNTKTNSIFKNNSFNSIITSDVDTPDFRCLLIHSERNSIPTISYPHGYYLYERASYMYLASILLVHGRLEENFAISSGVQKSKIITIGGRSSSMHVNSEIDSSEAVIFFSNVDSWSDSPFDFLYDVVDRCLQLISELCIPTCLKLHPMAADVVRWKTLSNKWNCRVDMSYWSLDDWSRIKFALCVGHPGSSMIDIASLKNKMLVVIPWSENDKQLLSQYNLAFNDADSAVKALVMGLRNPFSESLLLSCLSNFYSDCVDLSKSPSIVLSDELSSL